MKLAKIWAYVRIVLSGLFLLVVVILLALQWGNQANFSFYGRNTTMNTALLMLLSGLGGMVLAAMVWMLVVGIRALSPTPSRDQQHAHPIQAGK